MVLRNRKLQRSGYGIISTMLSMIAASKHFSIAILIIVCCYSSDAQDCGNCKTVPKLATFDFDVKVPSPNATDKTANLWPEWKNLFMIAQSVSSHLKRNEGKCRWIRRGIGGW
jgi:hypothetical protein